MNFDDGDDQVSHKYGEFDESMDSWMLKNYSREIFDCSERMHKLIFIACSIFKMLGYELTYLKDEDGLIYIVGIYESELGIEHSKDILMFYYHFKKDVIRYEYVNKVKELMEEHNIKHGLILSNTPALDDAKDLANNSNIKLIRGRELETLHAHLFLALIDLLDGATNDDDPNWYLQVDYEYLKTLLSLLRFEKKHLLFYESGYQSIQEKYIEEEKFSKTHSIDAYYKSNLYSFKINFENDSFDKGIITEDLSKFSGRTIIISNIPYDESVRDFARKNNVYLIDDAKSIRYMISDLIYYCHREIYNEYYFKDKNGW